MNSEEPAGTLNQKEIPVTQKDWTDLDVLKFNNILAYGSTMIASFIE